MIETRFKVGDVIRRKGSRTPWRVESIAPSDAYGWRDGRLTYHCVSLKSGRREEYLLQDSYLVLWTDELPDGEPKPITLKGHTLLHEGRPYDDQGHYLGNDWRAKTGRAHCSCGATSDVLTSHSQRKQWHRDHKDAIRAAVES